MPQGSRNLTWTCTIWNFLWCDWNNNFYSHSFPPSFRTPPPSVFLLYLVYFGTFQRIVRRGQAQRRTEQQDWTLLTPPQWGVQPLQAHAEAPFSTEHSKLLSSVWRQKASYLQIQWYLYLSHKAPSPFPEIYYYRINFCIEMLLRDITSNTSISLSPNGIQLHKQAGSRWLHWKVSGCYSTWERWPIIGHLLPFRAISMFHHLAVWSETTLRSSPG